MPIWLFIDCSHHVGGKARHVEPLHDIIIPDRYRYIEYGEKDSEHPLGVDLIAKAEYSTKYDYSKQIAKAKANSDKRIASSALFNEIEQLALKIKAQSKRTRFTLNLDKYRAEQKQLELDNKLYDENVKAIQAMQYTNTSADNKLIGKDDMKMKMKNDWNKTFEKDIYIQEAVEVLKDL